MVWKIVDKLKMFSYRAISARRVVVVVVVVMARQYNTILMTLQSTLGQWKHLKLVTKEKEVFKEGTTY